MDFIIGLPPSRFYRKVYDSILIIVNKYTKITRYIPITKEISIIELIELFVYYIIKDFSILVSITLDKGSIFTSNF